MSKRIFTAINLPAELKEKIWKTFLQKIPKQGIKAVRKENLHITLNFLGNITENHLKEITEKINSIRFQNFVVELKGIGEFSNRAIWIGINDPDKKIGQISKQINNALGTNEDNFHAHITIARNKHMEKTEIKQLVDSLNKKKFSEKLEVKSFDIMESKLGKTGPVYSKIFQKESA